MRVAPFAFAALALTTSALADTAPPQKLTLERVFASPNLAGTSPRALKLSPDSKLLTSLRPRADDRERYDLWAVDTATGAERMLVDSTKFGGGELSEAEKMQRERARIGGSKGIVAYDWAPDGKTILVPLDGDLFLATREGATRRLTQTAAGELNPTVSPKGAYAGFVRDQNLFVLDLATGRERAVTTEGKGNVHFGEAEFVAQEEMARTRGYWWSPDDSRIAVERFDEAPVGIVTRAAIGADGTKTFEQRYPAAGTNNVDVALLIIPVAGGAPVKVDMGPDRDIYLARVNWSPDGRTLWVQRQTRDQKRLDMLAVDRATGAFRVVFSETSKTWVELSDNYRFLKDGRLIWWSQRDGHGHLYLWHGGTWTQLTKGPWEVTSLVGVDEAKGRLFFQGNRDDVLETQVYALDYRQRGAPRRVTEPGFVNAGVADDSGTRLIVSRSNRSQPPQSYLADAEGKRIAWIEENALTPAHPYAPYLASHEPTRFGTVPARDGTVLHWSMITPRLAAGKRYPVFFEHYGGPTLQTVSRAWDNPLHQYLVDRGWIVFQIDNRGSDNRGRAFVDTLYHAMGSVEVEDQVAGATYLKTLPFVDGGRIATYGWSYGGYMTLKMLEKAPGVFAAGVAGAPVTKWELYDTHYTERYLGDPRQVPAVYRASGALDDAANIRDPLLLIHGMSDDNVVFDNSTAFAARMQSSATPFEMMFYPGQTHRVAGPQISVHLWRTIEAFLDRHVVNGSTKGDKK